MYRLIPIVIAMSCAPSVASARSLVFISDLHFGVGHDEKGLWHPYEDFRWQAEFSAFLKTIDRSGKGETDLVLNGDTFELWQSLTADCVPVDKNLGCSESEALVRIKRVLEQHAAELAELKSFAGAGKNRLYLIPGNHDAALLFPKVAAAVQQALPTVQFLTKGYFLSDDGTVYAEHGHQIGHDPNRFAHWPQPFLSRPRGAPARLERPWGEQFVQKFYNQYEAKYPTIDNLASEATGAVFGLAAEGTEAPVGMGRFFKFMLLEESWAQFRGVLGSDLAPTWDVTAAKRLGARFVVESAPSESALWRLSDAEAQVVARTLTEDDIRALCDAREIQRRAGRNVAACATMSLGSGEGTLGAAASGLLRSRNANFRAHLDGVLAGWRKAGCSRCPRAAPRSRPAPG